MSRVPFPSQAWFDEYKDAINNNEEYAEAAADWGVGFDGDFLFITENMPTDEIDMDALPDDLREELEQYVDDDTGYTYVGLEGGECTDAYLIEDPDDVEAGFILRADYDVWKDLLRGDIGAIDGMMSGKFELEGDMNKVMQYSQAAATLTDISAGIDSYFIDEEYAK
jgi:putative sterol carrier protein